MTVYTCLSLATILIILVPPTTSFKCVVSTEKNMKTTLVECETFCFTDFRVFEHSVSTLRRGCSHKLKVYEKVLHMIKYNDEAEDEQCNQIGIIDMGSFNKTVRMERICCALSMCNAKRSEINTDGITHWILSHLILIIMTVLALGIV